MRGLIFTELIEMVEEQFGYDLLDEVIDAAELENDAAYTATGNYPFEELVRIVSALSSKTGVTVPKLLEAYGEYLFPKLLNISPKFKELGNVLDFIKNVENYIHVEVRKLYPDVDLPTFELLSSSADTLELNYISSKNIPQLAKGLMMGAAKYFNEKIEIKYTLIEEDKTHFIITKVK